MIKILISINLSSPKKCPDPTSSNFMTHKLIPCSTSSSSSFKHKLSNKSKILLLKNLSIRIKSKKTIKSESRITMNINWEVMIKLMMSFLMEKLNCLSKKHNNHKFNSINPISLLLSNNKIFNYQFKHLFSNKSNLQFNNHSSRTPNPL